MSSWLFVLAAALVVAAVAVELWPLLFVALMVSVLGFGAVLSADEDER